MSPFRAELAAAALGGAAAYALFRALSPMKVRVGLREIDELVSPAYQAAVFPAFSAFVLATGREAARGGPWRRRALVIGATGAVSLARLGGQVPISGHALFLAAMAAFELASPPGPARSLRLALAAAGLAVTARAKARWGDLRWFAASTGCGAAIGAACAAIAAD